MVFQRQRPALQPAADSHHLWHLNRHFLSGFVHLLADRCRQVGGERFIRTDDAVEHLGVDAHGHDLVAAELAPFAPVEAVAVQVAVADGQQLDRGNLAEFSVTHEPGDVVLVIRPGRTEHVDQVGILPGYGQHLFGLVQVHGHAGLAEAVFAGPQGGDGVFPVPVGPGADEDGIDVVASQQGLPGLLDVWNAEISGHRLGAGAAAVGDGDDINTVDGRQAGEMFDAADAAGTDETDANRIR